MPATDARRITETVAEALLADGRRGILCTGWGGLALTRSPSLLTVEQNRLTCLAGVTGLALMMFQPLLIGDFLPGFSLYHARRVHFWTGALLVAAVVAHVAGLWITSPPDVIDALLFISPTPFSAWGVIAMWANLRRRNHGRTPQATRFASADVAHRSYPSRSDYRRRNRRPQHTN